MCRFVLYLGEQIPLDLLITRPRNSLIHQSYDSHLGREPLNGDGFGVAWYVPGSTDEPAQFRSIRPAWNDANLLHLARACRSGAILAHVRAASPGTGVAEANCHPFTAGPYAFMHNGTVANFPKLKRRIMDGLTEESFTSIQGTTDSEVLFALFRDQLAKLEYPFTVEAMASALTAMIRELLSLTRESRVSDHSYLNVAVTDGQRAVISRFATDDSRNPSLYVAAGTSCHCDEGVCRIMHDGGPHSSVVVASEPLNDDPVWKSMPPNHLLLIDGDRSMSYRTIA